MWFRTINISRTAHQNSHLKKDSISALNRNYEYECLKRRTRWDFKHLKIKNIIDDTN